MLCLSHQEEESVIMTIKETADFLGISPDTLRYYEKEGLLAPSRSAGGYRNYQPEDITILKNIVIMKYAHFTLNEMKIMEQLFTRQPGADCNDLSKAVFQGKVEQLRLAIQNYQNIILWLQELLAMIDSPALYAENKERIQIFINELFQAVRNNQTNPADQG